MIGIVSGGFKPFTKGHYFLVTQAAAENDEVFLFVSTKNRKRKGEVPLYFESQMKMLWEEYFSQILPANVNICYSGNPTSSVYSLLGEFNDNRKENNFTLYGDEKDLDLIYPDFKLEKYIPFLYSKTLVTKRAFSRLTNINISGTEMRRYLSENRFHEFADGLPEPVQKHSRGIYDILRSGLMSC